MFNLLKANNTEAEQMLGLPPTKMKLVASNLSVATAATGSATTDSDASDTLSVSSDHDSIKQQQELMQVDVLERIAEETYGADWNAWAHYDYDENMFEDVDMLRTNMKTTIVQDEAVDLSKKEREIITANEEVKKRQAENLMLSLNLSTDANVNFDNNVWQPWQYDSADVFVTHNNDIYVLDDNVKKAPVVQKKAPIVEKKENPKYVERETPYVGAFHIDWDAINNEKQVARMRYMCETSLDTDNAMQGVQNIWAQGRKGAYSTKEAQRSDIVETLSFGKDYREKRLMELEMKRKALAEQATTIDKWAHRDYDCADDIVVQEN